MGEEKCLEQCKEDTVKDIIKIRLHMWNLKNNYRKEEEQSLCALSETRDDTIDNRA